MFKKILSYFDSRSWNYHIPEPTRTLVLLGISTDNGKYQCLAEVDEKLGSFIFYSICSTNVPSEKRKQMAELLTRINFGLSFGNFELDFEDGEIRFRTSILCESIELTNTMIEKIVTYNVSAMDTNFGIITIFSLGELSIEEAIQKI
jgi:Putative bacterial sensory transduction regulator